jgi:hypothetical protein
MGRQKQSVWVASGIVKAPIGQVWQALIEVNPLLSAAAKSAIIHKREVQTFSVAPGNPAAGRAHIEVDPQQRRLVVKGEWWYCGVHSVEAHPRGSLLVYHIYNIAPGLGWWFAQLVQGPQQARLMNGQLRALLHQIEAQLECRVALLTRLSTYHSFGALAPIPSLDWQGQKAGLPPPRTLYP